MSLFAFGSVKASPGVTTAVLALAAVWPPDRQVVVAEMDPDGGDLAAWHDLSIQPGLLSYAAAGRRDLAAETILSHTQSLSRIGGVEVVAGPAAPEQADTALATLVAAGLAERLSGLSEVDVLVDCGRLRPTSPVAAVVAAATATVLVARPTLAEVAHLRPRVAALRSRRPALLLVGDRPYAADEVAAALDVPVLGVLAHDHRGAQTVAVNHAGGGRGWVRSKLVRSAVPVAQCLVQDHAMPGRDADDHAAPVAGLASNGQSRGRR